MCTDHTQTLKDVQGFNLLYWFIISQKCILREGTSKNAVYNSITEAFHCGWSIRRSFFLLFAGASSGVQKSPQDWPRLGLPPGRERAYICPSLTRSCPSLGRFKLMVSPGSVGGAPRIQDLDTTVGFPHLLLSFRTCSQKPICLSSCLKGWKYREIQDWISEQTLKPWTFGSHCPPVWFESAELSGHFPLRNLTKPCFVTMSGILKIHISQM